MRGTIHLVLFSNGENDPDARVADHLSDLIQFLKGRESIELTFVRTGDEHAKTVTCKKNKNLTTLVIPQPANKLLLNAHHSPDQLMYAKRLADILYPYLHNKKKLVFLANSVDYLRLFEVLKERYSKAKFIYVHREWSWKKYMDLADNIFIENWKNADISLSPIAFELTAYEQKMALIADKTITLSNQATHFFTDLLEIPSDKITIIKNGAEYSDIPEQVVADLRNYFGFAQNEKILLYAGKITDRSGVFYLIEVFKKMVVEDRNIRLVIAGEGNYDLLLAFAKPQWSRIVFTGQLTADELDKLILLANVGIVLPLYGQCSLAAINMRFRRLPLIISAIDGLDEYFEDKVDSLKINIYRNEKHEAQIDLTQLEEKIRRLLTDKKLAEGLSDNSYNIAMEKFTLNKMGNGYLHLLYNMFG